MFKSALAVCYQNFRDKILLNILATSKVCGWKADMRFYQNKFLS